MRPFQIERYVNRIGMPCAYDDDCIAYRSQSIVHITGFLMRHYITRQCLTGIQLRKYDDEREREIEKNIINYPMQVEVLIVSIIAS